MTCHYARGRVQASSRMAPVVSAAGPLPQQRRNVAQHGRSNRPRRSKLGLFAGEVTLSSRCRVRLVRNKASTRFLLLLLLLPHPTWRGVVL